MSTKTVQGTPETVSHFVTKWLDNLKRFVDKTSDEIAKADVAGANRRVIDTALDGVKDSVNRAADAAAQGDALAAVRELTTGYLEGARDTVRVVGEESQRINLVETGSKVTQEGIELLRRNLELGFETGAALGEELQRNLPFTASADMRPTSARVTFEADRGHHVDREPRAHEPKHEAKPHEAKSHSTHK